MVVQWTETKFPVVNRGSVGFKDFFLKIFDINIYNFVICITKEDNFNSMSIINNIK